MRISKSRRGRKRRIGVRRRSNGRVAGHRQAQERENVETATLARQRHFHLPERLARLPEAGSLVGRLYLGGYISKHHYEAAKGHVALRERYLAAMQAPDNLRVYAASGGGDRESRAYQEWVRSVRAHYEGRSEERR